MKFMHLSDLHLGKRVNGFSMLEDQSDILKEIIGIVRDEQVDAVLIAGDVYDKTVPSAEAVRLFDHFLTKLADSSAAVFVISGNHDSPERLSFGGNLMKSRNVYVSLVFAGAPSPIVLSDEYGEVYFYMLPFLKPAYVRSVYDDAEICTYNDAVREVIGRLRLDTGGRNVLLAHQFVTGASRCESEELSVGGLDNVEVSAFDTFDYVALGHIHGAQSVGRPEVRYCGTPLKYSFSESRHQKSVTIVQLGAKGETDICAIPLHPRRDMREIRGTYAEVTEPGFADGNNRYDYLHITLTDEEDIPDVLNRLRLIYPNIMKIDYDNTRTRSGSSIAEVQEIRRKTPLQLFGELYRQQNNQEMSDEQKVFLEKLIEQIWEE